MSIYEEINEFLENDDRWESKRYADCRWGVTFKKPCKDGGKFVVEISVDAFHNEWFKTMGLSKAKTGERLITLATYAYDEDGNCFRRYDPQYDYKTQEVIPDFLLGASVSNLQYLLDEAEKQAF